MTGRGGETYEFVSLLDVDNTLLDNDRVAKDLRAHLETHLGVEASAQYWAIFEDIRGQIGYADYLGALQRYRVEHADDPRLLAVSLFLIDYPFEDRLYDGALDVIAALGRLGPVVIFSDGDAVFQPRKVWRSGLWSAVGGDVLIYIHKEQMLDDVRRRFPARHYLVADDKLRILSAIKDAWHGEVTTVFPRQGHYALDPANVAKYAPGDINIDAIGELAPIVRSGSLTSTNPETRRRG